MRGPIWGVYDFLWQLTNLDVCFPEQREKEDLLEEVVSAGCYQKEVEAAGGAWKDRSSMTAFLVVALEAEGVLPWLLSPCLNKRYPEHVKFCRIKHSLEAP